MRIGIDARMYGPQVSGIGNYIRYLTDELFQIDNKHEYVLFLRDEVYQKYRPPHNRVRPVRAPWRWYTWKEQAHFLAQLYRWNLDVMHFPHFNVPLGYRKRRVVTIHDIIPFHFPGHKVGKSAFRRAAYRVVFRNAVTADDVIAVSEHTKKDIIAHVPSSKDRISVVYEGVPERFFSRFSKEEKEGFCREKGIRSPAFLYVGVWRSHKNVPRLVRAFQKLRDNTPQRVQLIIGGYPDPAWREDVDRCIRANPYKDDIMIPGFIPDEELPLWYQSVTALVHVSLYEGNALTCLEAMAGGTPVVASNTTVLPEILSDAAAYCDPEDEGSIAESMALVIEDKGWARNLVVRGTERARQFNWEDAARKTLAIYER